MDDTGIFMAMYKKGDMERCKTPQKNNFNNLNMNTGKQAVREI